MENNKFHNLPPHKRFSLLHQDFTICPSASSSSLPAKKRKETRHLPPVAGADVSTVCLPAKKRICALHPNVFLDKPFSSFDLNLEYDPSSDHVQEKVQEKDQEKIQEKNQKKDQKKVQEKVQEKITEKVHEKVQPRVQDKVQEKVHKKVQEKGYEEEEDEDGILCAVCGSTDGDEQDPIVLCDGCDLMVHTTCYGYPLTKGVPKGDWFCTQCNNINRGTKKVVTCCLCASKGGAMKATNDGRWAHIVCALFIPEVFFSDPEGREGVDCSKVIDRRWGGKCYVCKKMDGCVIDCSEEKCCLRFHVTCGLKEELCIEYKEGKNKGAIVAGFCRTHTDLWMKQQATGKFKIVARNEE